MSDDTVLDNETDVGDAVVESNGIHDNGEDNEFPQRRSHWKKVKDKATGKSYYFNRKTKVTQWEVPDDYESKSKRAKMDVKTDENAENGGVTMDSPSREIENNTPAPVKEIPLPAITTDLLDRLATATGEDMDQIAFDMVSKTGEFNLDEINAALSWKEVKDASTDKIYFYNKDSKVTDWKLPDNDKRILDVFDKVVALLDVEHSRIRDRLAAEELSRAAMVSTHTQTDVTILPGIPNTEVFRDWMALCVAETECAESNDAIETETPTQTRARCKICPHDDIEMPSLSGVTSAYRLTAAQLQHVFQSRAKFMLRALEQVLKRYLVLEKTAPNLARLNLRYADYKDGFTSCECFWHHIIRAQTFVKEVEELILKEVGSGWELNWVIKDEYSLNGHYRFVNLLTKQMTDAYPLSSGEEDEDGSELSDESNYSLPEPGSLS